MGKYISFIAPMYNMEKYIDDFMLSFKNLPKDKYELIVVDNASTDKSVELIEKHADVNVRIVPFSKRMGPGGARQFGLENMSKITTHFIFIDPDDSLIDEIDFVKILSLCDEKVKVNKNQLEGFTNGVSQSELPKTEYFKGAKVNVVGGNIYPVSVKTKFDAGFYEDFSGITKATSDYSFEYIDYPFIKVRRSKSSITNSIAKHPERLNDFKDEVLRLGTEKLIIKNKDGANFLSRGLFDIYVLEGYARGYKNITGDDRFNFLQISKQKVFGTVFFQKLVRFGGGYSKFGMRNYFK